MSAQRDLMWVRTFTQFVGWGNGIGNVFIIYSKTRVVDVLIRSSRAGKMHKHFSANAPFPAQLERINTLERYVLL